MWLNARCANGQGDRQEYAGPRQLVADKIDCRIYACSVINDVDCVSAMSYDDRSESMRCLA